VADLEQGRYEPSWPTVIVLAAALGVPVTAFLDAAGAGGRLSAGVEAGRARPPRAPQNRPRSDGRERPARRPAPRRPSSRWCRPRAGMRQTSCRLPSTNRRRGGRV